MERHCYIQCSLCYLLCPRARHTHTHAHVHTHTRTRTHTANTSMCLLQNISSSFLGVAFATLNISTQREMYEHFLQSGLPQSARKVRLCWYTELRVGASSRRAPPATHRAETACSDADMRKEESKTPGARGGGGARRQWAPGT